jgi:hypothetical protein
MQMLEVAEKLYGINKGFCLGLSNTSTYFTTVRRVETDTAIEESPFHIMVVVWRDIQAKRGRAQEAVLSHGKIRYALFCIYEENDTLVTRGVQLKIDVLTEQCEWRLC